MFKKLMTCLRTQNMILFMGAWIGLMEVTTKQLHGNIEIFTSGINLMENFLIAPNYLGMPGIEPMSSQTNLLLKLENFKHQR